VEKAAILIILRIMILRLQSNIQFIYELALARMELRSFDVSFRVRNSLRSFSADGTADTSTLKHRLAYCEKIDDDFTDYYFIQKYNQTRSVNQYLTHWIYPYKGKYHPQMIRSLLNIIRLKPGETVLDPFIGSGTTAVEAQLLGINCIGLDVSPLCVLISKVKTESIYVLEEIKNLRSSIAPNKVVSVQSDMLRGQSWDLIEDEKVRNFYNIAEMIAHSDESRRKRDFVKSFYENIDKMVESVNDYRNASKELGLKLGDVNIIEGDARSLDIPNNSVDGIITSPPYSIALNYVQNDAHSLKALGYNLDKIKGDFIGVRGSGFEKFKLYNSDMSKCFKEMYRVLKPNKFCIIVIGNVTYQGEEINTTGVTIDSCKKAGFQFLEKVDKIIFGLYNVMQKEYILIFRKEIEGE